MLSTANLNIDRLALFHWTFMDLATESPDVLGLRYQIASGITLRGISLRKIRNWLRERGPKTSIEREKKKL
jgi:hypothetical protein